MNIQAEKIELLELILETDNPTVLESVKKIFLQETKTDFWESLPQEQKEDIFQGLKDIENGDVIDYEDFMRKHRE